MITPMMSEAEIAKLTQAVQAVPAGGSIVEWGAGGSSCLIASEKKPDVTLTTVEHDEHWFDIVSKELALDTTVTTIHVIPTGDVSAFASIEEELDEFLVDYVATPTDISNVDLFLVDGRVRTKCLQRIAAECKPTAVVLLHDSERDWYIDGTALFDTVKVTERLTEFKRKEI